MEIRIKYHDNEVNKLEKINVGDWIDLYTAEDVYIRAGEMKLIPLGVSMQLPEGYEAIIAPRSSTYKKYHVLQSNGLGIIDCSYCGDDDMWMFPALAIQPTHIPKNTRICQFRILKNQPKFDIVEVNHLGNANRGGFGSTGD